MNLTKVAVMVLGTALFAGSFTSCKKKGCTDPLAENYNAEAEKDDKSCEYSSTNNDNIVKTGAISSDETWTSDKIYVLEGKVYVESGVTLTIEAGTIIKGAEGTGTTASALIVARGGKIMAEGTADQPIIFTSILDNIQVGEKSGTNLTENDNGKWGGVLILGYAPISAADGDTESQIEGIPATETFGTFGGSIASDDSGVLKYVSIRHGGALLGGDGNEINGLTLGGVGSSTVIENIEVCASFDDGIECFGGTVDLTNVIVGYVGDDAIDLDMNYSGKISNFITISTTNSDEGLEIDGPEGVTNLNGLFRLENGSVYSKDMDRTPADFKDKARGAVTNVKFYDFTNNKIQIRTKYTDNCQTTVDDAYTNLTASTPTLTFVDCEFGTVSVYTKSTDDQNSDCPVKASEQTAAEAAVVSSTATGADASALVWSWISENGKM